MTKKKHLDLPTFPPLARLFPDHPVPDEQELSFEFQGLAITLAELALNPKNPTPFTVVVKGSWGRGKTTLLRRAKYLVENPLEVSDRHALRSAKTLWFNAWKYPTEETVMAGLLGALLDHFRTGSLKEQLAHLVAAHKGSMLGKVLALAAPGGLGGLAGGEGVGSQFSEVEKKRAFHDSFRDLFEQLSLTLFEPSLAGRDLKNLSSELRWTQERQKTQVLAVFLDDLDRCKPQRVQEVLEAVSLFLDLPGVCFFMGVDWERLVGNLPPAIKDQGDHYLEKIVQVVLDLPEVSAGGAEDYVRRLVEAGDLEAILSPAGGDSELETVAKALESKHPRHIKRFLNDLSMTLAVLRNTGKLGDEPGQVDEATIFAWHLLSEVLSPEAWREVRAAEGNARGFLRRAMDQLEKEEPATGNGGAANEWRWLSGERLPERHLKALYDLEADSLHALVHFATPAAAAEPGPVTRSGRVDLFDIDSRAWVRLEGAPSFRMGSDKENEKSHHPVALSSYCISRYPITNSDYAHYVRETGKQPPQHWEGGEIPEGKERHPVVYVSWKDAVAFCTWLTSKLPGDEAPRGKVTLPSEAQWEFAARGAERWEYPWGSGEPTEELANFGGNVGDTTPVDAYPGGVSLETGIHDLAGNVLEWCADGYGPYPEEVEEPNPIRLPEASSCVLRGGSFYFLSSFLRGASRDGYHPGRRNGYIGFRVVWVVAED